MLDERCAERWVKVDDVEDAHVRVRHDVGHVITVQALEERPDEVLNAHVGNNIVLRH